MKVYKRKIKDLLQFQSWRSDYFSSAGDSSRGEDVFIYLHHNGEEHKLPYCEDETRYGSNHEPDRVSGRGWDFNLGKYLAEERISAREIKEVHVHKWSWASWEDDDYHEDEWYVVVPDGSLPKREEVIREINKKLESLSDEALYGLLLDLLKEE